jgi:hypothetical protein
MKTPIDKSRLVVFVSCHVMSCYWRISHRALLSSKKVFHVCPKEFRGSKMSCQFQGTLYCRRTVNKPNCTVVTDCSWPEWHCRHRQTVLGLNDNSVTNCSWIDQCSSYIRLHGLNDNAVTNRLFMEWMILQSQTDCSWTEWYCGHKQPVHGLNYDTAVTNRLFMTWMIRQSQTDSSRTERHCSHKQTVQGLNYDTAITEFMDWMTTQSQTDC